jgi:predicted acylesterase/phospholipase RssA/outer membrane translocation and assembly module TamA
MAAVSEKNNTYPVLRLRRLRAIVPFLLCTVLSLTFPVFSAGPAAADTAQGCRFALVLSGGGARGLSQIGVLKALEEARLRPDLIVGTSMGAIIGSFYACGYSTDSILSIVRAIGWNDVFTNTAKRNRLFVSQKSEPVNFLFEVRLNERLEPVPPNSISYGQAFFDYLCPLLAPAQFRARMSFDSLPVKLRIVTTDLLSGKKVVLSSGSIAAAVRASCGVPLAFSPVASGGMLLMDGGLVSNIPADIAREELSGLILAIDVTSPLWSSNELENPVRLMDQVIAIGIRNQKEADRKKADLVISPALEGFSNTDFRPIDTLVARGYECMRRHLDTLSGMLDRTKSRKPGPAPLPPIRWAGTDTLFASRLDSALHADTAAGDAAAILQNTLTECGYAFGSVSIVSRDSSGITVKADPGTIRGVVISGNRKTSLRLIGTAAGLKAGDVFSSAALRKAVSSLYATTLFNNVNIDMDTARNVRIMVDEKRYWRVRMGLRYDEFNLGEGFIQPAYENFFGRGVCAKLHLQYGLRREKYALELQSNQFLTANYASSAKLQTYLSTERIFQDTVTPPPDSLSDSTVWRSAKTLRKGGLLGLVGIQIGRTTMLSSGIHLELYKVQSTDATAFSNLWGLQFLPYALLRLSMDDLDRFPFPTSGMKNFFSIGGTSKAIGGNKNFFKFDGSARRVFTVFKKHTFSSQVRFAWSSDSLPEVEQIYLGGSFPEETHQDMEVYNYVPFLGLSPRALNGDVLGLAHCAYSFALKKNVYLTAGLDWGYTWDRGNLSWKKSFDEFFRYAPVGFGIGVSIGTIVGPVRFSYGRLAHDFIQKGIAADHQLYFSIGHDF